MIVCTLKEIIFESKPHIGDCDVTDNGSRGRSRARSCPNSHGEASPFLALGPRRMVCPVGGTVQYPWYNGPEDQVRLHGPLTLARICHQVRDLILSVPTNPYDTLKQQLIKCTAVPEQRRLQQLFHSVELGDR